MTSERHFFAEHSVHPDLAEVFGNALQDLGEYALHGGGPSFSAVYATTKDVPFAGATGMADTHWRLGHEDRAIAMKCGGEESELGAEWVKIVLFRSNWPDPDLEHWARRSYAFARGQ
jgi:hypothetical protein